MRQRCFPLHESSMKRVESGERQSTSGICCGAKPELNIFIPRKTRPYDDSLDQSFYQLTKITIFDKNYDFGQKLRFLTKITIFDKNYDVTKIWISDQNVSFWIDFYQKFDFWTKLRL